ncbi:hypothetical protein HPB48_005683 [Haemaphysalis longicornis]|uniref:Uncharacterized protein n=1 Tax=Haemaphysalis longicornis TaxID=44386 RepID=A0A9J6GSQ2_HAELO|nr:hypothetical protein HPB48_005683 [Haemaphysalis longicornis]
MDGGLLKDLIYSVIEKSDTDRKLFFLAEAPHVLKNIRGVTWYGSSESFYHMTLFPSTACERMRALEFKLKLRLIMLSQFFRRSPKANYATDDSIDLLEFVEVKKVAAEKDIDHSGTDEPSEKDLIFEDDVPLPLGDVEMKSLVYVYGYIARSLSRQRKLCTTCKEYLQADTVEDSDRLLTLKSYRAEGEPNPLVRPSRHVVALLEHADNTFRSYENQVLKASLSIITKVAPNSHQLPS